MGGAGRELFLRRGIAVEEALRQPHAARLGAHGPFEPVAARRHELRRAPADVDHQRPDAQRQVGGNTAQHQLGLLAAVEQARREPVAPLDLAQERLAVVGVAHGTRADGDHPLCTERLGLSSIVDEHVAHAGDRGRKQDAAPVDGLPESRDRLPTHDLLQQAVLDVGDEQARGVRAEVDGGDSHVPNRTHSLAPDHPHTASWSWSWSWSGLRASRRTRSRSRSGPAGRRDARRGRAIPRGSGRPARGRSGQPSTSLRRQGRSASPRGARRA